MSQLMNPAKMMPGATATMAASQYRMPANFATSSTVTSHSATTARKFRSKNTKLEPASIPRASATPVSPWDSQAISDATTEIKTGYSNSLSARNGAHGSSAKPRELHNPVQSE